MSVCDPDEGMHRLFAGVLMKQVIAPVPARPEQLADFERTIAGHANELAAAIVEPLVQAAGVMKFHSPDVLARIATMSTSP